VKNSSPSLKNKIYYCGHKRSQLTSIFTYLNPLRAHNLPHVCSDLAAPWLVACLSVRQRDFNPIQSMCGFLVETVALGQVFRRVLRFLLVNIINRCYILIHVPVTEAICA